MAAIENPLYVASVIYKANDWCRVSFNDTRHRHKQNKAVGALFHSWVVRTTPSTPSSGLLHLNLNQSEKQIKLDIKSLFGFQWGFFCIQLNTQTWGAKLFQVHRTSQLCQVLTAHLSMLKLALGVNLWLSVLLFTWCICQTAALMSGMLVATGFLQALCEVILRTAQEMCFPSHRILYRM